MVWALLSLCATTYLAGQDSFVPPGENIALHRPYTLWPSPSYRLCTDPGDTVQLTDGELVDGYFWVQPGCVGWSNAHPAIITVDLGSDQPILGASYRTAANAAGVEWPDNILLYVSDDRQSWRPLGDLVVLDREHGPLPTEYAVHRFWTDRLRTHGRYLAFLVGVGSSYTFCDEVEVYRGAEELLSAERPAPVAADLARAYVDASIDLALNGMVEAQAESLRATMDKAEPKPESKAALQTEIEAALAEPLPHPTREDRIIVPFSAGQRRLYAVQAALWRAAGLPPVTVWPAQRWEQLQADQLPPSGEAAGPATLDFVQMRNEVRGAAVNVSNAGDRPLELTIAATGLAGGLAPDWLSVSPVAWTVTRERRTVACALPEAPRTAAGWRVVVPAGMTQQLWFSVDSHGLPGGTQSGKVALRWPGGEQAVPLTLRVSPLTMLRERSLALGGWDYTDGPGREITAQNLQANVDFLQRYQVDAPWATGAVMPLGQHDSSGAMTVEPDPTRLRAWLRRWPQAKAYYIFTNNASTADATPAGARRTADWINFWVAEFGRHGIGPERIVLLVLDEPHEASADAATVATTRAIKAAQPKVQVYSDPTYVDPHQVSADLLMTVDVLCPNRLHWLGRTADFEQVYGAAQQAGKALNFYSCAGPTRALDPYNYYRLQAWSCFRYDMAAEFFWAFCDGGGAYSWNELYAAVNSYAPQFLGVEGATTSKQMEGIREGRYDYDYLTMLRDAVAEADHQPAKATAAQRGRAVLAESLTAVLDVPSAKNVAWASACDRGTADRARIAVLEALEALR